MVENPDMKKMRKWCVISAGILLVPGLVAHLNYYLTGDWCVGNIFLLFLGTVFLLGLAGMTAGSKVRFLDRLFFAVLAVLEALCLFLTPRYNTFIFFWTLFSVFFFRQILSDRDGPQIRSPGNRKIALIVSVIFVAVGCLASSVAFLDVVKIHDLRQLRSVNPAPM